MRIWDWFMSSRVWHSKVPTALASKLPSSGPQTLPAPDINFPPYRRNAKFPSNSIQTIGGKLPGRLGTWRRLKPGSMYLDSGSYKARNGPSGWDDPDRCIYFNTYTTNYSLPKNESVPLKFLVASNTVWGIILGLERWYRYRFFVFSYFLPMWHSRMATPPTDLRFFRDRSRYR